MSTLLQERQQPITAPRLRDRVAAQHATPRASARHQPAATVANCPVEAPRARWRVILGSIVELPAREDDPYDARFTLPRDLAKAGVKFALTSPSTEFARDLPYEAGFAAAYGLSHADALKAVTLAPAEILGVADRIGSIEVGKLADLVVTDGDLLELRTQVKNLFVAGKNVSLETKHTRLYEKYLNRP